MTLFLVTQRTWNYPSSTQALQLSDKLTWPGTCIYITLNLHTKELYRKDHEDFFWKNIRYKWYSLFCEIFSFYKYTVWLMEWHFSQ